MTDESPSKESDTKEGGIDAAWLLVIGLVAVVALVGVTALVLMREVPVVDDKQATEKPKQQAPPGQAADSSSTSKPLAPDNIQLEQIEQAMRQGNLDGAATQAEDLLKRFPEAPSALLIAARVATAQGNLAQAIELYDRIPSDDPRWTAMAKFESGVALLRAGDFDGAELRLRRALAIDANNLDAHEQLGRLLALEGRRWEGSPHLFVLIRSGRAQLHHLILAANLFDPIDEPDLLRKAREKHPDQWLPELGLARLDMKAKRWGEAQQRLSAIREHRPELLAVQVAWGELLAEQQRWEELGAWQRELSVRADAHPLVWWLRGRWAEATDQPEAAMRCYWESMRRYAGDRRPCHRLGQLLIRAGELEPATAYLDYAKQLDLLFEVIRSIYEDGPKFKHVIAAASLTESLGRYLESRAWYYAAIQLNSNAKEAVDGFVKLQELAGTTNRPVAARVNPASQFPQDQRPLPDWNRVPAAQVASNRSAADSAAIRFQERAAQLGVDFSLYNGDDPQVPGIRLHEDFGGGLGAIDYDGDGWPDLYLVQANRHPSQLEPQHVDRLYRNLRGERFVDVTAAARLEQTGYGQSLAVGDYNGDGFPDILIANIGANRLLRNEGDGTFTDVTQNAGLDSLQWTAAAAMVDLNGDGLDEIIAVNYLHGNEPLTIECKNGRVVTACRPTMFDPQADELYRNLGDGTFERLTLGAEAGRGLGIVAGDFDEDGRIDLFVANDMTANHLYWNESKDDTEVTLAESGLISGVAFDRDGRSQACMGVAAGDLTGDGRVDLFVTNFFNESNTLYVQQPDRLFLDQSAESGLRQPSLSLLGFGTQAADFDLDGDLDLIVANGHIDQGPDIEYKMTPQLFANAGGGFFAEQASDRLGSYFQGRYLGRGLLRWDFDRDGRADVAVSHLDRPVAVLQNATSSPGHYLSLRLIGRTNRRAVGARIVVTVGGEKHHYFVMAGDGYGAVNERRLLIGLGKHQSAETVTVHWIGGNASRFEKVAGDQHWLAVEGREQLLTVPLEP